MRFEMYQAKDGWRWRLVASNGQIVADGGEAYVSKGNVHRAVKMVQREMGSAKLVFLKPKKEEAPSEVQNG